MAGISRERVAGARSSLSGSGWCCAPGRTWEPADGQQLREPSGLFHRIGKARTIMIRVGEGAAERVQGGFGIVAIGAGWEE
ncbi:MAG: hypothetical protein OXI38_10710 [Bacteroidota bacterium]|nr:hypothetical protein [Bacteroidota bacterium]